MERKGASCYLSQQTGWFWVVCFTLGRAAILQGKKCVGISRRPRLSAMFTDA